MCHADNEKRGKEKKMEGIELSNKENTRTLTGGIHKNWSKDKALHPRDDMTYVCSEKKEGVDTLALRIAQIH